MSPLIFDGAVAIIVLLSALLAMVRGFSREVLSIGSWAAAAAAAVIFYPLLEPYVVELGLEKGIISQVASGAAIFLVTLIVVSFITMRISDAIIDSSIGALDRTLGFLFGAARGVLLLVIALLFFNWLSPNNQPDWITEAKSKPFLDGLGEQLKAALPENIEDVLPLGDDKQDQANNTSGQGYANSERSELNSLLNDTSNSTGN